MVNGNGRAVLQLPQGHPVSVGGERGLDRRAGPEEGAILW